MPTVEDYIEILAGLQKCETKFELEKSDYNLITSFGRQTFKGIGFTDRQLELAKSKIDYYSDKLEEAGYTDIELAKDSLRLPIRSIDRSRWIKIFDHPTGMIYESSDKGQWIGVRFTFQKKLISCLEEIKKRIKQDSYYDKVEKIHFFKYSEYNLYCLVDIFKEKNFEISEEVQNIYDKLSKLNKYDFVPCVMDGKLHNVSSKAQDYIYNEIGAPSEENLILYKDRSILHGIEVVDTENLARSSFGVSELGNKIANRSNTQIRVLSTKYSIDNLLESLSELKRFPALFVVPENKAYDSVVQIQSHIENQISESDISVMFRMENSGDGAEFNQYIKRKGINNKLDLHKKIVYTLDTKVPKPLLQSGWTPKTVVVFLNNIPNTRKVLQCFADKDLIIFYEDSAGHSTRFFFNKDLETL